MASITRLARLARVATLPETRRLIVAARRSSIVRTLAHRVAHDRAGLVRDATHPGDPRDLIRSAARHPAARELANASLVFLPMRYLPLGWAASWAATRIVRRYVHRLGGS
jgi:hypothetical protein